MAATTSPRNTPQLVPPPGVHPSKISVPIADNVKIYPGTLVTITAGYLTPATAAGSQIPCGRAASDGNGVSGVTVYDNTGTGHAAGAFEVPVDQGVFKWDNKAGDLLTQAQVGLAAYAEDNHTVRLTSTGSSVVGKVVRVDSDGVWVVSYLGQTTT